MKGVIFICCLILLGFMGVTVVADSSCDALLDKTTPFIGSAGKGYGYGSINPGAQYPHSALRLGPDTTNFLTPIPWRHFSGYQYEDKIIRGFSHTHLDGAGIDDLGNIAFMPVRFENNESESESELGDIDSWGRELPSPSGNETLRQWRWWSDYDKSTESARPGMYKVALKNPDVKVTLLATGLFTAVHRYEWEPSNDGDNNKVYFAGIVVDVCHTVTVSLGGHGEQMCKAASIAYAPDTKIITASVVFNNIKLYMHAQVLLKDNIGGVGGGDEQLWVTCHGSGKAFGCAKNAPESSSTDGTLFTRLLFGRSLSSRTAIAELHVGVSFISIELAKANLEARNQLSTPFEALVTETSNVWCDIMSKATFKALPGDAEMETMLYSALYHTRMSPSVYSETGGLYTALDGVTIHNVTAERLAAYPTSTANVLGKSWAMERLSDLSLWDTFRTQNPWLLLIDETMGIGLLRSMTEMTVEQNGFPRWILAAKEISCMTGLHGAALAIEAVESGLRNEFDLLTIQKALAVQAVTPGVVNSRDDVENYLKNGWVSFESNEKAAAFTLTFAYDDSILATLSNYVGDNATAQSSYARSFNYKSIWGGSEGHQYMCPRTLANNGALKCPSDGAKSPSTWNYFIEGDALHWSLFVPHDLPGLIQLHGGPQGFAAHMDEFMQKHVDFDNKFGNFLPNPYYWGGNEVCMLTVWMMNLVDPTHTQYWSRKVTHLHFTDKPTGLPGNDDYGTMSAWLMTTSLGIFPLAGSKWYFIGSPRVEEASLTLIHKDLSTSTLRIVTHNNSPDNVYVESLVVNGIAHTSPLIERSVLTNPNGCTLEFFMTATKKTSLSYEGELGAL